MRILLHTWSGAQFPDQQDCEESKISSIHSSLFLEVFANNSATRTHMSSRSKKEWFRTLTRNRLLVPLQTLLSVRTSLDWSRTYSAHHDQAQIRFVWDRVSSWPQSTWISTQWARNCLHLSATQSLPTLNGQSSYHVSCIYVGLAWQNLQPSLVDLLPDPDCDAGQSSQSSFGEHVARVGERTERQQRRSLLFGTERRLHVHVIAKVWGLLGLGTSSMYWTEDTKPQYVPDRSFSR